MKKFKVEFFILFQILFLLSVTLVVLAIFHNRRLEYREEKFIKNSIQSHNKLIEDMILNNLSSAKESLTYISNVINADPIESITSKFAIYLKFIMDRHSVIWSIYIAYPEKSFFQISRVSPKENLIFEKKTPIPPGTKYRYRLIDGSNLSETWFYVNHFNALTEKESIPKTRYDPTKRTWYINTSKSRQPSFTDAYIASSAPYPIVSISAPLLPKNIDHSPIVSLDIRLENISRFISNANLSTDSYTYVVNRDSNVIAQSNIDQNIFYKNRDTLPLVKQLKNRHLEEALIYFKKNKENIFYINVDNIKYIVNVSWVFPSSSNGWKIISITNYNEYMNSLVNVENYNYSIFIFIIFIACIQGILIARRVSNPIQDLTVHAKKIGCFDLEKPEKITSMISEFDTLAKTISSMRNNLIIFTKYMPIQLVKKLVRSKKDIEIGGEKKDLTLLFTDIKGFSTVSEQLSAEELMLHLSVYFDEMSKIIMEYDGVIDKYIGDAIMSFWGAPDDDPSHGKNACFSVLKCLKAVDTLNTQWEKEGKPVFQTRFGLHYGSVVVGNIGSADRINYTVIGDNVNLAARLEGANKYTFTSCLVSESVYEQTKNDFIFRSVDIIVVKGKTKGVHVYELIGCKQGSKELVPSQSTLTYVATFNKAFEFYINSNFERAIKMVSKLDKLDDNQKLIVATFIESCKNYIKTPPPESWSGERFLDKK